MDAMLFSKIDKTMYIGQDFNNSSMLKNLGPLSGIHSALQGLSWIFTQVFVYEHSRMLRL